MIPLFIPFAIDAALGTLGDCPDVVHVPMRPLPDGVTPYTIADDREIYQTFHSSRRLVNICSAPHFADSEFAKQAAHIVVTSGPLPGEYDVLGPVDVSISGFDYTRWSTWGFVAKGVSGSTTRGTREFYQAPPAVVNEAVRREALLRYGLKVDGVINVEYMTNPKNDVSATGLAVAYRD